MIRETKAVRLTTSTEISELRNFLALMSNCLVFFFVVVVVVFFFFHIIFSRKNFIQVIYDSFVK